MLSVIWWFTSLFIHVLFQPEAVKPSGGQLVLFIQEARDTHFLRTCLPKLQEFATSENIPLRLLDVGEGVPEDVTSTPALVYQHGSGSRAVYAGRYTEFSTIVNFVRINRGGALPPVELCWEEAPLRRSGRTQLAAKLKITPLNGFIPEGFDVQAFQQEAQKAIVQGMESFAQVSKACLQRSDRTFYLDFHPYRSTDGRFFLSFELFSQFHCIDPVFSAMKEPLSDDWSRRSEVFHQAAKRLEAELLRQLERPEGGEMLSFLPEETPVKSWAELGLNGAANEQAENRQPLRPFSLPARWVFSGAVDKSIPLVQFYFAPPLDRYAGELRQLDGELQLSAAGAPHSGRFEVRTRSLTMGLADFDAKVHKSYLQVGRFPEASFSFDKIEGLEKLQPGQTSLMAIEGTFELMKRQRPVQVQAQLTPFLDEDGERRIRVEAAFSLKISDDFGIQGPDGPEPARQTMLFRLCFLLQPA